VVLPIVQRILGRLGLPSKSFEISAVNFAAASSADIGLKVAGFSADVSIFLAVLSAALRMPVPQDLVATGHLASLDGDIRLVRHIPAKVAAAAAEPTLRRFIYPCLDADRSLEVLSPGEQRRAKAAIAGAPDCLRAIPVRSVEDLIRAVFSDETIVLASLKQSFFDPRPDEVPTDSEDWAVLAADLEPRFWQVLERHMFAGHSGKAKTLLSARAQFEIRRRRYPNGLGLRLFQLIASLPPATRRLKRIPPLLGMDRCIQLGQFAGASDHEDFRFLVEAVTGKTPKALTDVRSDHDQPAIDATAEARTAVDAVLEEISADALAQKIGLTIDAARAAFIMDGVTVESHEAFHDTLSAFYLALLRHTQVVSAGCGAEAVAGEAWALLERAFASRGGTDGAWAQARFGIRGGLRLVLDVLTEQYKIEQQGKHVSRVLKEAIDPLDWERKVAFMAALLERIGPQLPPDIRGQPVERYARYCETIAQGYVQSLDRVKELLRRL